MEQVSTVEFKPGSREELLPNFDRTFPCITTCYVPGRESCAPWHWHGTAELFFIEEGALEYATPSDRWLLPAGSGGLILPNVPHMTRSQGAGRQLLHLFDPTLISGTQGSRMEEKYVLPLTTSGLELLVLDRDAPSCRETLRLLQSSFALSPREPGYELRLRAALSEIWFQLLEMAAPRLEGGKKSSELSQRIRAMMVYVHEHYGQRLSAADLAGAACISERSCFALFRDHLHTTPMGYVLDHRLREACRMLAESELSVTEVAAACGLGTSSYFAKVFREKTGLTPLEYRKRRPEGKETP